MEICGVGGYSEVGKNMTAMKVGSNVVIFDMGFYMQKLMDLAESDVDRRTLGKNQMLEFGAIPDDRIIGSWRKDVKAIVPSHCHLDHIGAIPYMAPSYNAPIIGSPYTMEILKNSLDSEDINIPNKIKSLPTGEIYEINKDLKIELIHVTHSTPNSTIIAAHTKEGIVLYSNDFKLDDTPVLGDKPDYSRLKEIGSTGKVKAIVLDALYSRVDRKTPSENVAKEGLKEIILDNDNNNNAIFATCFASNMARLKTFADLGRKLNRKVLFFGRSMYKYVHSAQDLGLVNMKHVEIIPYRRQIERHLKLIKEKGPENYLVVATGGQGEPNSVLSKILKGQLHFKFSKEDLMIFSNMVIPVEPNVLNRKEIEDKFKAQGVRVATNKTHKNIHVSGHGSLRDMEDLLKLVNPEHIIPSHGDLQLTEPLTKLTDDMGYRVGKELHLIENGKKLKI